MKTFILILLIIVSVNGIAQTVIPDTSYKPVYSRSAPASNDSVFWWPYYYENYTVWEALRKPGYVRPERKPDTTYVGEIKLTDKYNVLRKQKALADLEAQFSAGGRYIYYALTREFVSGYFEYSTVCGRRWHTTILKERGVTISLKICCRKCRETYGNASIYLYSGDATVKGAGGYLVNDGN